MSSSLSALVLAVLAFNCLAIQQTSVTALAEKWNISQKYASREDSLIMSSGTQKGLKSTESARSQPIPMFFRGGQESQSTSRYQREAVEKTSTLPKKSHGIGASKLETLTEVTEELRQMIQEDAVDNFTLSRFTRIMDKVSLLPTRQEPDSKKEARAVLSFLREMELEVLKMIPTSYTISKQIEYGTRVTTVIMGPTDKLVFEVEQGYPVFAVDDFSLASTFKHPNQYVGYIIYPANVSALRTLPKTEFPITKLQVVDIVYREKDDTDPVDSTGMIILRWSAERYKSNLRHACAYWNEDKWTSEHCIALATTGIPKNVSCFCSMLSHENRSTEFIFYEYEEDLESTIILAEDVISDGFVKSGTFKLQKYINDSHDLVAYADRPGTYSDFLSQLSFVMRFNDESLVSKACDSVYDDIGTILERARSEDVKSTIGVRNNDLASFVMNLNNYKLDPPIGFGVYVNYSYGIEYFRQKDLDYGVLFAKSFSYSFLFSKSVASQNSRYAFLIYPPNKFLKPSGVIQEHQVSSMRVLDVVLTTNKQNIGDQFVHMFTGKIHDTDQLVGCAFWSVSSKIWITNDCYPNPDLHDGVCTCSMSVNFVVSPSRGQYIIYKYETVDFTPGRPVDHTDHQFNSALAIFMIQELKSEHVHQVVSKIPAYLNTISQNKGLKESSVDQVIADVNTLLRLYNCDHFVNMEQSDGFVLICGSWDTATSGFPTNMKSFSYGLYNRKFTVLTSKNFTVTSVKAISSDSEFALHVSPAVITQYPWYGFVLYPISVSFHPLPAVAGHRIDSFRIIDFALKESEEHQTTINARKKDTEQYVEFYFDHPQYLKVGCGYWSVLQRSWNSSSCKVISINGVRACNCTLTANLLESKTGGQYIVYSYSTAVFDDTVYKVIGSELFTVTNSLLTEGGALIQNASQLLTDADGDLATKIMHIFHKILSHVDDVSANHTKLTLILSDLQQAFDRFYVDPGVSVSYIYDIETSWSVKSAEIANDMFSNVVLSASEIANKRSMTSDLALVVVGHLDNKPDVKVFGVQFEKGKNTKGTLITTNNITLVTEMNPAFAIFGKCYELLAYNRFIFVVYPLNMSPYPYTMTNHPVFNSRQVDIYVDRNEGLKRKHKSRPPCDRTFTVYFQPTENPKSYIKISCSSWNETSDQWTKNLCKLGLNEENRPVSCICNTTEQNVTRILMYEYTDFINFSHQNSFEGLSVVFLIGSSFSLLGFALIISTAILFPTWRQELSNKILFHLTASSLVYLCLGIYRETHLIYAELKSLDLKLVAFTACFHYARLVHFCWGLIMSVLQYKKFSSVVGASSTSHLLFKVSLFAWGVPLAPLAVLLSWNQREHFCIPDKLTHYMLYLVPAIAITLLNIGLMVATIYNMTNGCCRKDDEELKKHGGSSKDVMMRQLKQSVMMFFIFGIPTVFEMFNNLIFQSTVMDYIGNVLNPILGFVMFLFFVLMHDKARGLWNVRVFGDVVPVTNPKPVVKKIPFKLKVPKKTPPKLKVFSNQDNCTETTDATIAIKHSDSKSAEQENILVVSDAYSSGNAVKHVAQCRDRSVSSTEEGFSSNEGIEPCNELDQPTHDNDIRQGSNQIDEDMAVSNDSSQSVLLSGNDLREYVCDLTRRLGFLNTMLQEASPLQTDRSCLNECLQQVCIVQDGISSLMKETCSDDEHASNGAVR